MKEVVAFAIAVVVVFAYAYAETEHASEHAEYTHGFSHEGYCAVAPEAEHCK